MFSTMLPTIKEFPSIHWTPILPISMSESMIWSTKWANVKNVSMVKSARNMNSKFKIIFRPRRISTKLKSSSILRLTRNWRNSFMKNWGRTFKYMLKIQKHRWSRIIIWQELILKLIILMQVFKILKLRLRLTLNWWDPIIA